MAAARTDSASEPLQISSDLRLRVQAGREIELEVLVGGEDDLQSIAARLAGDPVLAESIAIWNSGVEAVEGAWLRVPLALLTPEYRRLALQSLFPRDRRDGDDWIHVARAGELPTYDEGLWQVATWFTGRGENFRGLMRVNGLGSPELRTGQTIRIPADLLVAAFRPGLRSDGGHLEFASDERGPYAGYRLRRGEALYSSVVVRFTGRTSADDVIATAEQLRQRSDIRDLRDIPVGYLIKIPLDLLEPQYLPQGHPRRREAEAAQHELARALAAKPVQGTGDGLAGVLIILDPGHGGRDLGTMNNGIWEHDYVYDVSCRLKQTLETETAARVVMTLEDAENGCTPSKSDKLEANRQGTILTTPPFLAREEGEARIGVNLRWYLANSIFRRAVADGVDPDRIVFVSVRVRSEAVSLKYAEAVVQAFRDQRLPIQPYQPIRNRIIRGKSRWVPAVLRGNAVPTKVLVEMVNLSNREDAALLSKATDRERMAEALVRSLFLHFGESPPPS
jgi:N-acetylmuramoyl-L-alanine amidase